MFLVHLHLHLLVDNAFASSQVIWCYLQSGNQGVLRNFPLMFLDFVRTSNKYKRILKKKILCSLCSSARFNPLGPKTDN